MPAAVLVERGGWATVLLDDRSLELRARFGRSARGRIVVASLELTAPSGVSGDVLRSIPAGLIEAWANGPDAEALRAEIDATATPATLEASGEVQRPGIDATATPATLEASGEVQEPRIAVTRPQPLATRPRSLRLTVPTGQPVPDRFYKQLAAMYSRLTASARPATEIAEANDVPVGRVHGWVREARLRGFLPPGERSKRAAPMKARRR